MSNSDMKSLDPIFYPVVSGIGHGLKSAVNSLAPKMPQPEDLPVRGESGGEMRQTEQVATREQETRMALAASGVTKSANQRDVLGGKSRDASRTLLGGR